MMTEEKYDQILRDKAEAYQRGRQDYTDGKSMSDNPYRVSAPMYQEWLRGWESAVEADPLIDADEKRALLGLET